MHAALFQRWQHHQRYLPTLDRRKSSDKFQSDVGTGSTRNEQWMKQAGRSLIGVFAVNTNEYTAVYSSISLFMLAHQQMIVSKAMVGWCLGGQLTGLLPGSGC